MFQAKSHRGRVEFHQLGELGIDAKVGTAWAVAQDKTVALKQFVEDGQKAQITGLNDRPVMSLDPTT